MSLNRIIIMGRMTKDVELRHTQSGVSVASFTLAVDRDVKDKQTGERGVDFIDCVAWRNTADFAANYFGKGRAALVEGKLQFREWTDKEGNKRRNAEVQVDSLYFGDSKKDGQSAPKASAPKNDYEDIPDDDGDLPF